MVLMVVIFLPLKMVYRCAKAQKILYPSMNSSVNVNTTTNIPDLGPGTDITLIILPHEYLPTGEYIQLMLDCVKLTLEKGREVTQLLYVFHGHTLLGVHHIHLQRDNWPSRLLPDGTFESLQVTTNQFPIGNEYPNHHICMLVTLPLQPS